MRFKIGDTWYERDPTKPFMVELEPGDRLAIARMPSHTTRISNWPDGHGLTEEQRLAWMNEGSKVQAQELTILEKPKPGCIYTMRVRYAPEDWEPNCAWEHES